MSKKGYGETIANNELSELWIAAAGAKLASRTRIGTIRRGKLEIIVENSAVLQELTFQKRQILKTIKETDNEHGINDIRFKVGPIS